MSMVGGVAPPHRMHNRRMKTAPTLMFLASFFPPSFALYEQTLIVSSTVELTQRTRARKFAFAPMKTFLPSWMLPSSPRPCNYHANRTRLMDTLIKVRSLCLVFAQSADEYCQNLSRTFFFEIAFLRMAVRRPSLSHFRRRNG